MKIYMVSIARPLKNTLGIVESETALGNLFFEDKADAEFHAAELRDSGLNAYVWPRIVIRKEPELSLAS